MTRAAGYSDRVRALFADPPGGGDLPEGPGERVRGEAGSPERGAWVVFEARVLDGRILQAAFRAWGCPHVIAACSVVAGRLGGQPVAAAGAVDVSVLAGELGVPPEKLGRLLVVHEAATALASLGAQGR